MTQARHDARIKRSLVVLAERYAAYIGDCPLGALPEASNEVVLWSEYRACADDCDNYTNAECWAEWARWSARNGIGVSVEREEGGSDG